MGIMLIPAVLSGQTGPQLEPLPIVPSLAELGFRVGNVPPMVIHSSGCVALFDEGESQIVCIDPDSGATHRFGRHGAGPGEFNSATGMIGLPDGGLLVFDPIGNVRFTLIDRNWKLKRVVRAGQQFLGLFRPTSDSVLTIGGPRSRDLIAVSLHDGGVATRFAPSARDTALFIGPYRYDFFGFWLVPLRRGGWYIVSPWHYSILVADQQGQVLSRFGRNIAREPLTEKEFAAATTLMRRMNPGANLDPVMEQVRKTPKPVIQRAPVEDTKERLWVPTGRVRQDSTELDVFDPNGHFIGTRRVPGEVQALAAAGMELYILVEYLSGEQDGTQGVLRYRIR
jgi:hypothetical protein